jgi:hypothetical protein
MMKRCPQCYEVYDESERFCEVDGKELLTDPAAAPEPQAASPAPPAAGASWLPAATLGVLIGIGIGAGIFAAITLSSASKEADPQVVREAPEYREQAPSVRATAVANPAPTAEPEESPSPEAEEEAQAEASPQPTEDNKTVVTEFNRGPISTGKKPKTDESEVAGLQTVIEMNDGSTLDVDAAWEDKQGIWYRRSGLVSFVESSRVKAITARKGVVKTPELQDR